MWISPVFLQTTILGTARNLMQLCFFLVTLYFVWLHMGFFSALLLGVAHLGVLMTYNICDQALRQMQIEELKGSQGHTGGMTDEAPEEEKENEDDTKEQRKGCQI